MKRDLGSRIIEIREAALNSSIESIPGIGENHVGINSTF
jgi:hypothetical protein